MRFGCFGKPFRSNGLIEAVAVAELLIRGQEPQGLPKGLELYETGWPPRVLIRE